MNKTEKTIVGAFLAFIIIAGAAVVVANGLGYTKILGNWKFPLQQTGDDGQDRQNSNNQTGDQTNLGNGVGTFQAQVIGEDSADPNTAYTVGAGQDFYVNWYSCSGAMDQYGNKVYSRMLTEIANPTSTQDLLDMRAEYGGYVYAAIHIPSGKYFYVDYTKMMQDPYLAGYQFLDIDNSGQQSFVFQYNMQNHYIPNQGFPVITFKVYLMEFDTGFGAGSIGLQAPANNLTTGASQIDMVAKWYYNVTSAKKYIGIYEIELKINTTDLTKVNLKNMEIPGRGQVAVASFTKWQTATDIRYSLTFSQSNYFGALYEGLLPNAADNEFDMYATLSFTLPSDHVSLTLTLYCLNAPVMSGFPSSATTYASTS